MLHQQKSQHKFFQNVAKLKHLGMTPIRTTCMKKCREQVKFGESMYMQL